VVGDDQGLQEYDQRRATGRTGAHLAADSQGSEQIRGKPLQALRVRCQPAPASCVQHPLQPSAQAYPRVPGLLSKNLDGPDQHLREEPHVWKRIECWTSRRGCGCNDRAFRCTASVRRLRTCSATASRFPSGPTVIGSRENREWDPSGAAGALSRQRPGDRAYRRRRLRKCSQRRRADRSGGPRSFPSCDAVAAVHPGLAIATIEGMDALMRETIATERYQAGFVVRIWCRQVTGPPFVGRPFQGRLFF
jgi:hypothetical protein